MLQQDTKIIMAKKNHKSIQDVFETDIVKTKYGDNKVVEIKTSLNKENGMKLIFSDGYKVTVTESQEFLMYNTKDWKKTKDLVEGDLLLTPDNTYVKLVDITKVKLNTSYNIVTEKNNGYILANGLYSR